MGVENATIPLKFWNFSQKPLRNGKNVVSLPRRSNP